MSCGKHGLAGGTGGGGLGEFPGTPYDCARNVYDYDFNDTLQSLTSEIDQSCSPSSER